MSRPIGAVAGLIVLAVALPTITGAALAAVPFLLSLLIVLAIFRLALPLRPRHRR